ncbi:hypothetical protein [Micromonospora sp. LOL_024]|uniref:hypothetical protein n=1 Tax=Micromonospora sp. LOL_024 TaxID=3345412 RepID=UPI003A8536E4
MTQPDDATEALPTQRVPAQPAVTTRHGPNPPGAPGDAATVSLAGADPTVVLDGTDPTVVLGRTGPPEAAGVTAALGVAEAGYTTAATAGARTGGGAFAAPTAGPGGELRFGPGVPVSPPPAPAWPTPAPPPRRRSAWRKLVSLLSTLLTLALLAAVGLWIWQRLSPLEIVEVNAAVPRPAGQSCDVSIDVVATVRTNGRAGVVEYQWLRSGSAPGALLTERVGWGQRSVELTLRWSFSGVGSTTETATVNIVAPSAVQAATEVSYACSR